jgi:hypothetical protein
MGGTGRRLCACGLCCSITVPILIDIQRLQVTHVFCVCAASSKFSFISGIDCDSGNDAQVVNSFTSDFFPL